jgi:CheY-like chemotaxis protein
MQQIVWNLLSNAIKFTSAGGRVEVSLRRFGAYAEIVVSDTGIGIGAQDIPQLFERFRQPGPSTTRRYGGLGLGLSIAKRLVELHGGTIRAASDGEGTGSTFTVELPLKSVADREPADRSLETATHADGISLSGLTVLVVEDEAEMRTMIQMLLEDHGAQVISAASAAEALQALRRGPDIIVSDIRLPDVDGYDLIRAIRASEERYARAPAVALTAFARPEDRTRAIRAGFQGHITKPFEATELLLTVACFADLVRQGDGRSSKD